MGNPLYNALNGTNGPKGGPMAFLQQFPQFMQQMRGKNPAEMVQQLVSSGKINQAQLDQAQQMAKQLEGPMSGFKSMFGFK